MDNTIIDIIIVNNIVAENKKPIIIKNIIIIINLNIKKKTASKPIDKNNKNNSIKDYRNNHNKQTICI